MHTIVSDFESEPDERVLSKPPLLTVEKALPVLVNEVLESALAILPNPRT